MSREIRRVRPDWVHPIGGSYSRADTHKPLNDDYAGALVSFEADPDDWEGRRPDPFDYMPQWSPEEATAYQVYETVTEGTPISPVLKDRASLLHWLTTEGHGLGVGGRRMPLTNEQAERFIEDSFAPSMVAVGNYFGSGLTAPTRPKL